MLDQERTQCLRETDKFDKDVNSLALEQKEKGMNI